MSEGSSDEGTPGWEFVKNEDLETSDGESVEVIGFSCPEDESDTDVVIQGEEAQESAPDVQTVDLVEMKKFAPKNNVWESFVAIMAVTSVGFAVASFLIHAEEVKLDPWTIEPSSELSVALEELQNYQQVNIALNKEIHQLKQVNKQLEIQVSRLQLQIPNYEWNDKIIDREVKEKDNINDPIIYVETESDRTLNENLMNLTSNFKSKSDSLIKGLKISMDDLNEQVAQNILKTSWDIRSRLYQNLCLFGHFDSEEECKNKQMSPKIVETIDAYTKEVAFSWMKFYEEVLEKKFAEISHNIEKSSIDDFLTHFNSSSELHQRKAESIEKPKKQKSQKAQKMFNDKREAKKHEKIKEGKQQQKLHHKKFNDEKQRKKLKELKFKEEKPKKKIKEEKHHEDQPRKGIKERQKFEEKRNKKLIEPQTNTEEKHKKIKERKHKEVKENKQNKKLKEDKEHKKLKKEPQVKEKNNHPLKNEKNYKREKPIYKKNKEKENQSFYFDKKTWKYIKFTKKENKTRLYRPNGYKLNKNCFNKTFDIKKEGWWFTDLGKHRSGIRWEKSRSDWQFDRARNRRLRKS